MKYIFKILMTIILGALAVIFAMQTVTYIWDFSEGAPFSGDVVYNPYAGITDRPFTETFSKSNFHAHASFDTRHKYTAEELIEAYKAQGYKNIGITDHQHINSGGIIPSYEHGYGINNFHVGMYGASSVDWIDIPYMFLPRHQMQTSFLRLKNECDITVFNHSDRLRLMSDSGIENLRGYSLFELYPTAVSEIWDRVLSTGFYVPLVANDDAHSIINRNSQFQRAYTMTYNGDSSPFQALLYGHSYGVVVSNEKNSGGHIDFPQITKIEFAHGGLTIETDRVADSILFIGQGGRIRAKTDNADSASYKISESDTYVRIEVFFNGIRMFTNPIARTGRNGFYAPLPEINWFLTILNWVLWTIAVIADIRIIFFLWKKKSESGYYNQRRSSHFEDRVIGAGLKAVDWN